MSGRFIIIGIFGLPMLTKLVIIYGLANSPDFKVTFANIYLYEIVAVLLLSLPYLSFDLFLTRNWNALQRHANLIVKLHALFNIGVGSIFLFFAYFLLDRFEIFDVNLSYFVAAFIAQVLINIGRVTFALLRMQKRLLKLFLILTANQLVSVCTFFYILKYEVLIDHTLIYFTVMGLANFIFPFVLLVSRQNNITKSDMAGIRFISTEFLRKNWYADIVASSNVFLERMFFTTFFGLHEVGVLALIQKLLQPLDALSRFVKLQKIHEMVSLAEIENFHTSQILKILKNYIIGVFLLSLTLPLFILLFLNIEVHIASLYGVCLAYVLFVNSVYLNFRFFRKNAFGLFVLCDLAGLLSVVVLQLSEQFHLGILTVFSLKLLMTIASRTYISLRHL